MAMSIDDKRKLIYVSERIKELQAERTRLNATRADLEKTKTVTEEKKRQRIYIAERMPELAEELRRTVQRRFILQEGLGMNAPASS